MAKAVQGVNPEILRWARIRSGRSLEDVALIFKKKAVDIESWESGESAPTYVQLENLAYKVYKRPIALFFFPEPPEEEDPTKSFRTLPQHEIEQFSPDTLYAIRQALPMQISLKALNDGINPSEKKIFRDIKVHIGSNTKDFVARMRDFLSIKIDEQISWKDSKEAFKYWRKAIQDKGIFVFKRSFKQKDISGFCLIDEEFPIIFINDSAAHTRQIFTLFHELSHVLLHTNGVTKIDDSYIETLTGDEKAIELFCNRFATEFLVPTKDFENMIKNGETKDQFINDMAYRYKVSREVILRKLLDRKIVDQEYYETKVRSWRKEYEGRYRKSGGNYYATQATYLGDKFIKLAFGKYYQGSCTIEQLADHLNIKVKSVAGLEHFVYR